MTSPLDHIPKFIRRLMPNATEAELHQASEVFSQYMAVVLRIYERKKQEEAGADSPHQGTRGTFHNTSTDI